MPEKSEVFKIFRWINSPIPYIGGKRAMRGIIISLFPRKYGRYVEPFGGGASILFGKQEDDFEVYNDFNGDLVNMFRCIKDRPMALLNALKLFPLHSRQEFNILQELLEGKVPNLPYMDNEIEIAEEMFEEEDAKLLIELMNGKAELYDVERAAAFYKLIRYSYGSGGKSFGGQPVNLLNTLELIVAAAYRLRKTIIENKDFGSIITQYDRPDTFFYIDPPYVDTEGYYMVGFNMDDHIRLHSLLKEINGKFLLSYNDCEFVKELYKDFTIVEWSRANPLAHRHKPDSRFEELLIANYDINERRKDEPKQLRLFGDGEYECNYLQDYRYKRPNSTTVYIPTALNEQK